LLDCGLTAWFPRPATAGLLRRQLP
jgi:hypothetical protein